jgi:hypothetical protein
MGWKVPLVAVVIALGGAACGAERSAEPAASPPAPAVAVAPAPPPAPAPEAEPGNARPPVDELAAPDGSVTFKVTQRGHVTEVRALSPITGTEPRATELTGAFGLPVVTQGGQVAGVSHDGSTLVLQGEPDLTAEGEVSVSRLAVLDTTLWDEPRLVGLKGSFTYDAISPDGRFLYLVEHVPPASSNHYRVRQYDLANNRLIRQPIVDKRLAAAGGGGVIMQGYPVARAESRGGDWVFTLYQTASDAVFVHALNTAGGAVCIGIPKEAHGDEAAAAWTLRFDEPGPDLLAENTELGVVVRIDTMDLRAIEVTPLSSSA